MRIGGKGAKFLDIPNLNDLHLDKDELDIKTYIEAVINQTRPIIDNNRHSSHENIIEHNNIIGLESEIGLKNINPAVEDEFDIQTNSIEVSVFSRNKANSCKSLSSRASKYYNNKKYQLYKTEMCRSHSEVGFCKYGNKCQFAHDPSELRDVLRHPRYKTETCRTFWEEGSCPYGKRCCFIHVPNNSKHDLSSQLSSYSTPIVDITAANNDFNDIVYSDESCCSENDCLFGQPKINNMIEYKDKNEITFDLSEINLSDIDIDNTKTIQEKPSVNKYEIDELYVNSLFVQDQKPFWSTNEANIWSENSLFYIKRINRFF